MLFGIYHSFAGLACPYLQTTELGLRGHDSCSNFGLEETGMAESRETWGYRLERIRMSRGINNGYALPVSLQAQGDLSGLLIRWWFWKVNSVTSPLSPGPSSFFLCQPRPTPTAPRPSAPTQKQPGHLMLLALGEGCGRVESKWPACFLLSHTSSKDYTLREKCQKRRQAPWAHHYPQI